MRRLWHAPARLPVRARKSAGGILTANARRNSNPTGKVRRKANLQRRRIYVAELGKTVIVDVSVKGLKTIKKNGAFAALTKAGAI